MGLGDLFKPKYKHSDRNKRIEAVKNLNDQKILVEIAKNDSDKDVRKEAVCKISDEGLLIKLADDNDAEIVVAAYNQLINLNAENYCLKGAINNMSNCKALTILFENADKSGDYFTRNTISYRLEKLTELINDKQKLIKLAQTHVHSGVREVAVKKINDESVLIDIAKNDPTYYVREVAVKKINDGSVLIDIAKNDESRTARQIAVGKINDESALADIAKNDEDFDVRYSAVEKISDESVLLYIARNDNSRQIQKLAGQKYKSLTKDKIKENSSYYYNQSLSSFEEENYMTPNIYELDNYESLIILFDGTNLTNWDEISPCSKKVFRDGDLGICDKEVCYISENFSNKSQIIKRKYKKHYSEKRERYIDPVSGQDGVERRIGSQFSHVKAIVISGISDKITDLSEMFYGCTANTISFVNCDFSNVANTRDIFYECNRLHTIHADENSLDSLVTFVPESRNYIDGLPKFDRYNLPDSN